MTTNNRAISAHEKGKMNNLSTSERYQRALNEMVEENANNKLRVANLMRALEKYDAQLLSIEFEAEGDIAECISLIRNSIRVELERCK